MAKIAIIGTGMAGMGCAHFLHRHHELTVFETGSHVGGHANTIAVPGATLGRDIAVDSGFMVYNDQDSPLLARLFAQLQVPVRKTALTFSVRDDRDGVEWRGSSLGGLFARRKNLANLRFLRLLAAIRRFNRELPAALADPATAGLTLGEFVRRRGHGVDLVERCLAPAGAALWRLDAAQLSAFPADLFLRFYQRRHGPDADGEQPAWLTVDGGARACRERLISPWRGVIQLGRAVTRIVRNPRDGGVTLMTADGASHLFDKVVVATHADQALRLLVNPTADESAVLSAFRYAPVASAIHTDAAVLPRTPRARAACNHQFAPGHDGAPRSALHYWVNRIQDIPEGTDFFVTLGGIELVDSAKILRRFDTTHLVLTLAAQRAQPGLPRLNEQARGRTETYFAGSYFGAGFHEDALASAVKLAGLLLDRDPWAA